MLHQQTVSKELLDLTSQLLQDKVLADFRLVGGTALSLQLGHREKDFVDMYYILEKFPLDKVAEAYAEKYPDVHAGMAKLSVREFERLHRDTTIVLTDKSMNWGKVQKRLREAVIQPAKLFLENSNKLVQKNRLSNRRGGQTL